MSADDTKAVEEDCTATFTPLVELDIVAVPTGEEDERCLWSHRCVLYRFSPDVSGTMMWCNRGIGDIKIMQHKENNASRLILREDKTMKLRLNAPIQSDTELQPNGGSEKAWTWGAIDHSEGNEEGKIESFAVRFKTPEIAQTYKKNYDLCREGKFEELLSALSLDDKKETETTEKKENEHDADVATWNKIMEQTKTARMGEKELKELWDQFDKDSSGFIELGELEKMFDALVDAFVTALGTADEAAPDIFKELRAAVPGLAKANMQKLDTNKDNKVSWEEFKALEDVALALVA